MLRHAHFYMKGGMQTFAAVCIEVHFAGQNRFSLRLRRWLHSNALRTFTLDCAL